MLNGCQGAVRANAVCRHVLLAEQPLASLAHADSFYWPGSPNTLDLMVHKIREGLMVQEWELRGRRLALRRWGPGCLTAC